MSQHPIRCPDPPKLKSKGQIFRIILYYKAGRNTSVQTILLIWYCKCAIGRWWQIYCIKPPRWLADRVQVFNFYYSAYNINIEINLLIECKCAIGRWRKIHCRETLPIIFCHIWLLDRCDRHVIIIYIRAWRIDTIVVVVGRRKLLDIILQRLRWLVFGLNRLRNWIRIFYWFMILWFHCLSLNRRNWIRIFNV